MIHMSTSSSASCIISFYNGRKIHSSIGDRSPLEFYERSKQENIKIKEIRV